MITIEEANELERASKYFLQKLSYAKNALTSLTAMQSVSEYHSPDVMALAEKNFARTERDMLTAADDLRDDLNKLLPDSAAAQTGGKE